MKWKPHIIYLSVHAINTKELGHGKLSTYPFPKPALTLTSHFAQNVDLGEGRVGSFPKTYNDPHSQGTGKTLILSVLSIALALGIEPQPPLCSQALYRLS